MIIDDITNELIQKTIDDGGKVYVFNQNERFEVASANNGTITIKSSGYKFDVNDKLSFIYLPKYKTPYVVDNYADTDGDGIIDLVDLDADGDGVIDPRVPLQPEITDLKKFVLPLAPNDLSVAVSPSKPVYVSAFEYGKAIAVNGYYPLYITSSQATANSPTSEYHEHILDGRTYYMPEGVSQWHGTYMTCVPDEPEITDVNSYDSYDFEYVERAYADSKFSAIRPIDYGLQTLGVDTDENGSFDSVTNYSLEKIYNIDRIESADGVVSEYGESKYNYYKTIPEQSWIFEVTAKELSEDVLPEQNAFVFNNYVYQLEAVNKFDIGTEDNAKHTESIFRYLITLRNGELADFDSAGASIIERSIDDINWEEINILQARSDRKIVLETDQLNVGDRFHIYTLLPPAAPIILDVKEQPPIGKPEVISVEATPIPPSIEIAYLMPAPVLPSDVELSLEVFGNGIQTLFITYNEVIGRNLATQITVESSAGTTTSLALENDFQGLVQLDYIGNSVWELNSNLLGNITLIAKGSGNASYQPAEEVFTIKVMSPASAPSIVNAKAVTALTEQETPSDVVVDNFIAPNSATPLSFDTIPLEAGELDIDYSPLIPEITNILRTPAPPIELTSYRYDSRPAGWFGGKPTVLDIKEVFKPDIPTQISAYRYDARPVHEWDYPAGVNAIVVSSNGLGDFVEYGDLSELPAKRADIAEVDLADPTHNENIYEHNGYANILKGKVLREAPHNQALLYFDNRECDTGSLVFPESVEEHVLGYYVHTSKLKTGTAAYEILQSDFGINPEDIPDQEEHVLLKIAEPDGSVVQSFNTSWRIQKQHFIHKSKTLWRKVEYYRDYNVSYAGIYPYDSGGNLVAKWYWYYHRIHVGYQMHYIAYPGTINNQPYTVTPPRGALYSGVQPYRGKAFNYKLADITYSINASAYLKNWTPPQRIYKTLKWKMPTTIYDSQVLSVGTQGKIEGSHEDYRTRYKYYEGVENGGWYSGSDGYLNDDQPPSWVTNMLNPTYADHMKFNVPATAWLSPNLHLPGDYILDRLSMRLESSQIDVLSPVDGLIKENAVVLVTKIPKDNAGNYSPQCNVPAFANVDNNGIFEGYSMGYQGSSRAEISSQYWLQQMASGKYWSDVSMDWNSHPTTLIEFLKDDTILYTDRRGREEQMLYGSTEKVETGYAKVPVYRVKDIKDQRLREEILQNHGFNDVVVLAEELIYDSSKSTFAKALHHYRNKPTIDHEANHRSTENLSLKPYGADKFNGVYYRNSNARYAEQDYPNYYGRDLPVNNYAFSSRFLSSDNSGIRHLSGRNADKNLSEFTVDLETGALFNPYSTKVGYYDAFSASRDFGGMLTLRYKMPYYLHWWQNYNTHEKYNYTDLLPYDSRNDTNFRSYYYRVYGGESYFANWWMTAILPVFKLRGHPSKLHAIEEPKEVEYQVSPSAPSFVDAYLYVE